MRFKFWDRSQRQRQPAPTPPRTNFAASLAAARQRVAAAEQLNDAANELLKKSDRTLAVNGFGPMIDAVYGADSRREP